ncbi:DUF6089 family protein [Leeuwenhoekiella sp. MAR_2009_132]|uniref:type IX secretion system protein PorG n=1 Tax=Leeuwenhoekiella sp. MAR_2009_132 TaxID=1392489 RepID=UPI0004915E79|nr:DUF6089 family protein [Leeuwenhoekiella sp. MAR_2009_132]
MNLRVITPIIILFLSLFTANAQKTYDIGLYLGGTNYIGEIGNKSYLAPNRGFFGVVGKLNFNEKIALRGSFTYMNLHDNDRDAKDTFRGNGRGENLYYSFDNTNLEGTLALEYTPFQLFLDSTLPISPYVYTGFSILYGDELYYPLSAGNEDVVAIDYGNKTKTAIPVGLGLKAFVSPKIQVGIEFTMHLSSTDNLDGTEPEPQELEPNRMSYFQKNDIYNYLGLTLTYRLGKGGDDYCDCNL